MGNKILLVLDSVFAFFGAFWAGVVFFRALSLNFVFVEWVLLFGVMLVFLYPLIRKAVEVFTELGWEGIKESFEDYWKEKRVKKRWDY